MLSLRENRERHENVCFGFYRPEENDDLWGDEGTDREVMSAFIEDTFDFGRWLGATLHIGFMEALTGFIGSECLCSTRQSSE